MDKALRGAQNLDAENLLYNRFEDVHRFVEVLKDAVAT